MKTGIYISFGLQKKEFLFLAGQNKPMTLKPRKCFYLFLILLFFCQKLYALSPFPATVTEPVTGKTISFDAYIKGVLIREMPYGYGWKSEALKALAVAARCAYMRMGSGSQAYNTWDPDDPGQANHGAAVDDTTGQGIIFGDEWIYAYHFSHDAADFTGMPLRGHTVSNEDSTSIGGWAKPWLRQKDCNCKAFQQQILAWKERRGHGVGMCQFGAWEMAKGGKSYKEILTYYYNLHMPYVKSVKIKQGVETPKYYAYWSEDGNKRTLQPTTLTGKYNGNKELVQSKVEIFKFIISTREKRNIT